jgi:hypothetical protein
MKCLSDAQIQAVVDNEAAADARQHAASCARCADRIRERERLTAAVVDALRVPAPMPPGVAVRVDRALADGSAAGATRLREIEPSPGRWRAAVWSGGAVAAATIVAVMVVAPALRGPSTVSAAEILARSADRLAERATAGVEFLEYDLTLDGVPREMMPDHIDGAYQVKQIIDHDRPGRYLAAAYAKNGDLVWGVAQDPARRRRVIAVRIDDQSYRFEFALAGDVALSPPEMERLHMEASVAMMQASGNQSLEIVDTGSGRQYRIDVPSVAGQTPTAVWDLSEARAIIDAADYHVIELAVRGTFLKQPYSVSYRLKERAIVAGAGVQPGRFELPADTAAIVLEGEGSAVPVRDALMLAMREVSRLRRER